MKISPTNTYQSICFKKLLPEAKNKTTAMINNTPGLNETEKWTVNRKIIYKTFIPKVRNCEYVDIGWGTIGKGEEGLIFVEKSNNSERIPDQLPYIGPIGFEKTQDEKLQVRYLDNNNKVKKMEANEFFKDIANRCIQLDKKQASNSPAKHSRQNIFERTKKYLFTPNPKYNNFN